MRCENHERPILMATGHEDSFGGGRRCAGNLSRRFADPGEVGRRCENLPR